MLKTFKGFKGKAVFGQIGDCKFVLLAERPTQLAALWSGIMGEVPLDPSGISNAILIESETLPEKPPRRAPSISPITHIPPIEV